MDLHCVKVLCEEGMTQNMPLHNMYNSVATQIIKSSSERKNYHLYHYEDMVNNPLEFIKKLYCNST